jgi:long-chain acyl-CoA synthetase
LKSGFVAQIYVHGDSLQSELIGVVVPDQEFCLKWALDNGILPPNTILPPPPPPNTPLHPLVATISKNEKFRKAILDDLSVCGKKDKLRGFEFIKAIHIHDELFTAEGGLLTPTFKVSCIPI